MACVLLYCTRPEARSSQCKRRGSERIGIDAIIVHRDGRSPNIVVEHCQLWVSTRGRTKKSNNREIIFSKLRTRVIVEDRVWGDGTLRLFLPRRKVARKHLPGGSMPSQLRPIQWTDVPHRIGLPKMTILGCRLNS